MAQFGTREWKGPKKKEGLGAKLFKEAGAVAKEFPWNVYAGSIPGLGALSTPFQIKELVDASGKLNRQRDMIKTYMLRDISGAGRGMGPTASVARGLSPMQAEKVAQHFATKQANARALVQIASMQRRPPIVIQQRRGTLFLKR